MNNMGLDYDNPEEEQQNGIYQESLSITKQDQTQSYSNSTMCHALSAAENLAYRIYLENGGQKGINQFFDGYKTILQGKYQGQRLIFDAYDSFDGGKKKPITELATQLIFLIENFKDDYFHYKSLYQKYDYPRNLNEDEIINIILHWFHIIKDIEIFNQKLREYEFSKYYSNFILVLTNQPSLDYTQDIYKYEANNPNKGKINPNALAQGYSKALKEQEKYLLNNAKTKNVDLYGQNALKMENNNNAHPNNNPHGGGRQYGNLPKTGGNNTGKNAGNRGGNNNNYYFDGK
jgi:hypothetical protein